MYRWWGHCVSKTCIISLSWQYCNCLFLSIFHLSNMWILVPSAHEVLGIELWPCRGRRYTNDQMRDVRCGVLFRHTSSFTVFVSEIFQAKCVWLWNEGHKDHAFCYFPLQSRPFAFARTWLWLHTFLRTWLDYCPWDRFQPAGPGPEVNWEGDGV